MTAAPSRAVPLARPAAALGVAVLLVAVVDLLTNEIGKPIADGVFYVDMATHGVCSNDKLVAPFAYRPVVPWIAGGLADALSLSVPAAFAALTRLSAVLQLFLVWILARSFGARFGESVVVMATIAMVFPYVKVPVFFDTLVDVEGFCFMLAAALALYRRHMRAALLVCGVGMLVKEFLIVPFLLLLGSQFQQWRREGGREQLLGLLAGVGIAAAAIVAPRALLPVHNSFQFIDPIRSPETLGRLVSAPLDVGRSVNLLYSWASVWLPSLLLLTPSRLTRLRSELRAYRALLLAHLLLVHLLATYGGTNIPIFVAYSLPVQVVVLTKLLGYEVAPREVLFMLAAVAFYHKVGVDLPPADGSRESLFRLIDVFAGWSSRLTASTAMRTGQMLALLALAAALRAPWRRG